MKSLPDCALCGFFDKLCYVHEIRLLREENERLKAKLAKIETQHGRVVDSSRKQKRGGR